MAAGQTEAAEGSFFLGTQPLFLVLVFPSAHRGKQNRTLPADENLGREEAITGRECSSRAGNVDGGQGDSATRCKTEMSVS